jgi:aldose 1-epimerase
LQRLLIPNPLAGSGMLDVVHGFDNAIDYCVNTYTNATATGEHPYFGALIGRVANRIADCSFTLEGNLYTLPCNEYSPLTGKNDTLHGGTIGYDRRVWTISNRSTDAVTLSLFSPHFEMGFPANVDVTVTYTLTDSPSSSSKYGGFDIQYSAVNDDTMPTLMSMSQHTYWMLGGFSGGETTVLNHILTITDATTFQEVDKGLIPTGAVLPVTGKNSFMDFTKAKAIGADIVNGSLPTGYPGYDNSFLFDNAPPGIGQFVPRVTLTAPASGLRMIVTTDQPCVQVYSGNFLAGDIPRKLSQGGGSGVMYEKYSAVVFETQQRIGAANDLKNQPAITLNSNGGIYTHHSRYDFSAI